MKMRRLIPRRPATQPMRLGGVVVGLSINEVSFRREVVVDVGMDRGELLKRVHSARDSLAAA
jgi:hypothetical protein